MRARLALVAALVAALALAGSAAGDNIDPATAAGPPSCFGGDGLIGTFVDYPNSADIVSFDDPTLATTPVDSWSAVVNLVNFPDLAGTDPLDRFVRTGSTAPFSLGVDDVSLADLLTGDSFLPTDETFTATFDGFLNVTSPGTYGFALGHDDGARLTIGGTRVIDFNRLTDFRMTFGTATFATAGAYPIRAEMFENGGEANLVLFWSPPGAAQTVVPTSALFSALPGPQEVLECVVADLQAIMAAMPDPAVADKIEDALDKVETSLAELAKTPPDRQAALGNLEGGVGDLEAAVKDGLLSAQDGGALMDRIAGAARQIAHSAIDEAIAGGGKASDIETAQQSLVDGDSKRAAGQFKDAVAKYKDALAKAEGA